MIFRFTSQSPKPQQHKSITPSHFLSDPAFSPDPHSNPYFVSNRKPAWASSPPVGHPVLKHKQRRPLAKFATDGTIASADFDFQLIQPPNSPVSYLGGSGTQNSPQYPFPTTLHNITVGPSIATPSEPTAASSTAALSSLGPRIVTPAAPPASSVTPQPPAVKEPKKKRMPFLSRRKTSRPAETYTPQNTKDAFVQQPTNSYDVTQDGRPAAALRVVSEPIVPQNGERPAIQARSMTTGTDTPRSTALTSSSMGSKRQTEAFSGRMKDLDKIDELDETNPWGVALHHGGPYEAAVKALRAGKNMMPLGMANGGLGDYHNQAHGHAYTPPQAPVGVSLNLSPGQILPRNFHEKRGNPPPRMREGPTLPPRMQATLSRSNTSPTPSLYRSQSHAVPSSQSAGYHSHSTNRMESPPDVRPEPSQYRRQSQPPTSSFSLPYANHHLVIAESRQNSQPDPFLNFRGRQSQGFPVTSPPAPPPKARPESTFIAPSEGPISQSHVYPITSPPPPQPEPRFLVQSEPHISQRPSQAASPPSVPPNQPAPQPTIPIAKANPSMHSRFEERRGPLVEEEDEEEDEDEDGEEYDNNAPLDIGLAMLRSEPLETLRISPPRIYLPPGTQDDELEFDPYDPVHLEKEHSRTPSPLVVLYARSDRSHDSYSSREPSLAPSLALSHGSSSHESSRVQRHEPFQSVSQHLPQGVPPPQSPQPLPRRQPQQLPQIPNRAISRQQSQMSHSASPQLPPRNPSRTMSTGPPAPPNLRVRNPELSTPSQYQERVNYQKQAPVFNSQGSHQEDPPPYNAVLALQQNVPQPISQIRAQDQFQSLSRSTSPGHAPSWKSNEIAPSDDSHNSRRQGRPNVANSTENIFNPSVPLRQGLVPPPNNFMQESQPVTDGRPNIPLDAPSMADMPPMLPPRRSRERIQAPTPAVSSLDLEHERVPHPSAPSVFISPERDAGSIHPSSVSTHSSSLTRNTGLPPPHRRVPKHLVMPAPLNNNPSGNNNRSGMHGMVSPPPRMNGITLPPRMNAMGMTSPPPRTHYPPPSSLLAPRHASLQFQPQSQPQQYYPRPLAPPTAVAVAVAVAKPPIFVPSAPRAQEIPIAASRKLKKRGSVMSPPSVAKVPPAPLVSTVSFAPPVIGYGNPSAVEKNLARSKTEKIPKRVLSKRRTDI